MPSHISGAALGVRPRICQCEFITAFLSPQLLSAFFAQTKTVLIIPFHVFPFSDAHHNPTYEAVGARDPPAALPPPLPQRPPAALPPPLPQRPPTPRPRRLAIVVNPNYRA